jgi:hypothetical protein
MRGALRGAVVGAAVLTQACAGGIMDGAPGTAGVQSAPSYGIYGTDSYFKVEWQPDERRGRPIVSGYVTNQWGLPTKNVRLRDEALRGRARTCKTPAPPTASCARAPAEGVTCGAVSPSPHRSHSPAWAR